jgi:uncharacterized membrane protein
VAPLPFNMALMEFLAAHRTAFLTHLFLAATFLGDTGGYILIVTLIYVAWNKRLAVRLSVLVLLASSLNVVLKLIVKNPRPFVREGTCGAVFHTLGPRDGCSGFLSVSL